MRRSLPAVLILASGFVAGSCAEAASRHYDARFSVAFDPPTGLARASIGIEPGTGRVSKLDLAMPVQRYRNVRAVGGAVQREGERVVWQVPRDGGTLTYDVVVDHQRPRGGYDARMTDDWAIVRGDVLFPPARVRATKDTDARSRLAITLPKGWTDRESGYTLGEGGEFVIVNPSQRFDRPVGWIAAGNLTTTKETIDGVAFRVAAPKGEGFDRIQVLAMLRATVPEFRRAFGDMPKKVLIVGAGDPMWRGGLAGPRSFWLHAQRRLVSENGTSPLLHEMMHTVTRMSGGPDDDWIVEGLAEYYSIELARRGGLLSDALAARAIRVERKRGEGIKSLQAPSSSNRRTARAVALFADLDAELRKDGGSLDEVVRKLMREDRVTLAGLRRAAGDSDVLETAFP